MTNTCLQYLYRDTSNYKQYGSFTYPGTADATRVGAFLAALTTPGSGPALFVPEQVGLPNLCEQLPGHYDDDDGWHEITDIVSTPSAPDTDETFEAFLTRAGAITVWDDHPRLPWGSYPIYSATAPNGYTIEADRWLAEGEGTWVAVHPGESEADWFAGHEQADPPSTRVAPIDQAPKTGRLLYRTDTTAGELVLESQPTPGQITISAEQIREWTGRALTPEQLDRLAEAIAHSTIPEVVAVIVDSITR
jgi:hypothetical protein